MPKLIKIYFNKKIFLCVEKPPDLWVYFCLRFKRSKSVASKDPK